ncbi:hypothetical protein [Sphingomonas sp.]|uniref:hypothetical protein n=1 Tax=Sphingomonas sp. TaxID=28214 RepID=UPI00180A920E|nr:hypothetical protein [Sphingomonas sp.]MBA3510851.1 hypothetical protein [Sphingomonas sp.]
MSEHWISAIEAWTVVWPAKKPTGGPNSIINRAGSGAVKAKASLLQKSWPGGETKDHDCPIPEDFWRGRAMIPDWDHGDFSARVQWNEQEQDWKAIGVTFERSGIDAMVAQIPSTSGSLQPVATEGRSKRGRPVADDWEAVIIELARQLYAGELQPKRLADIEKAIVEYLAAEDVTKSESTIREHARPFWTMYEKEAGK